MVRDVVSSFDPVLASRVSVEVDRGAEVAFLDGGAVRRILVNLLDNAVRYGPEGQRCGSWRDHGDGIELTVEDEGPGIARAERERVWLASNGARTAIPAPGLAWLWCANWRGCTAGMPGGGAEPGARP